MKKNIGLEMRWIAAILAVFVAANLIIVAARPALLRSGTHLVEASLQFQKQRLAHDLEEWQQSMITDGRWAAQVAALALDAHTDRLDSVALSQVPTARLWIIDRDGHARDLTGNAEPNARHRWLAAQSLSRGTTVVAATEALDNDLRIGVASPLGGRHAGWTAVLDISAAERLLRRLPDVMNLGRDDRVALTFPFTGGFVGTTWMREAFAPKISWPKSGWTLSDSSLVVTAGTLRDTMPRFQIGVSRDMARRMASTNAFGLHAATVIITAPVCIVVLLVGRASRNAKLRDAELRVAQAESAAARAGLAAIQARLHPHFLSNALHSASALIGEDPEAAEETLDRLGDLFRYALESGERRTVRLADEWRFVRDYLEIEQLRLGDRLRVEMHIDDAIADVEVPAFVLQPLVENAIRHGIGPRRDGGIVRVVAATARDGIELIVEDNGVGIDPVLLRATRGTGLRTLRERLALDSEWRGRVETRTAAGQGFAVRIFLRANVASIATM